MDREDLANSVLSLVGIYDIVAQLKMIFDDQYTSNRLKCKPGHIYPLVLKFCGLELYDDVIGDIARHLIYVQKCFDTDHVVFHFILNIINYLDTTYPGFIRPSTAYNIIMTTYVIIEKFTCDEVVFNVDLIDLKISKLTVQQLNRFEVALLILIKYNVIQFYLPWNR